MNEHETVKYIQQKLRTEIQGLMLEKQITLADLLEEQSPVYGLTLHQAKAIVSCYINNIRRAQELRDWLKTTEAHGK